MVEETAYDARQIQVLEGLQAVRKRPAMYVGSVDSRGLHHLVHEVVDNSIDEAMAGFCKEIQVTLNEDGSVTVADDGRGIPVDLHPKYGVPGVELVLSRMHSGGKFERKMYRVSGGLHGVGLSVVNGLSEWLEVRVRRDGEVEGHHADVAGAGVGQRVSVPQEPAGLRDDFGRESRYQVGAGSHRQKCQTNEGADVGRGVSHEVASLGDAR